MYVNWSLWSFSNGLIFLRNATTVDVCLPITLALDFNNEKCVLSLQKTLVVKGASTFDHAVFTFHIILVIFCVEFGETKMNEKKLYT